MQPLLAVTKQSSIARFFLFAVCRWCRQMKQFMRQLRTTLWPWPPTCYGGPGCSRQEEQNVTTFACCVQVRQTVKAVFEAIQDRYVALTASLLSNLVRAVMVSRCNMGCGRTLPVESVSGTMPVWLLHLTDRLPEWHAEIQHWLIFCDSKLCSRVPRWLSRGSLLPSAVFGTETSENGFFFFWWPLHINSFFSSVYMHLA